MFIDIIFNGLPTPKITKAKRLKYFFLIFKTEVDGTKYYISGFWFRNGIYSEFRWETAQGILQSGALHLLLRFLTSTSFELINFYASLHYTNQNFDDDEC